MQRDILLLGDELLPLLALKCEGHIKFNMFYTQICLLMLMMMKMIIDDNKEDEVPHPHYQSQTLAYRLVPLH